MSCSVVSDFIALRDVNRVNHAESALPANRAMVFVSSLIIASFVRVIV